VATSRHRQGPSASSLVAESDRNVASTIFPQPEIHEEESHTTGTDRLQISDTQTTPACSRWESGRNAASTIFPQPEIHEEEPHAIGTDRLRISDMQTTPDDSGWESENETNKSYLEVNSVCSDVTVSLPQARTPPRVLPGSLTEINHSLHDTHRLDTALLQQRSQLMRQLREAGNEPRKQRTVEAQLEENERRRQDTQKWTTTLLHQQNEVTKKLKENFEQPSDTEDLPAELRHTLTDNAKAYDDVGKEIAKALLIVCKGCAVVGEFLSRLGLDLHYSLGTRWEWKRVRAP
jgi:hypothetical protein